MAYLDKSLVFTKIPSYFRTASLNDRVRSARPDATLPYTRNISQEIPRMGFCITNRNARHWAAGGVPKRFRALKERRKKTALTRLLWIVVHRRASGFPSWERCREPIPTPHFRLCISLLLLRRPHFPLPIHPFQLTDDVQSGPESVRARKHVSPICRRRQGKRS